MWQVECPVCETEVEANEWIPFTCPKCNNKADWDEEVLYNRDGTIEDTYPLIIWERYEE